MVARLIESKPLRTSYPHPCKRSFAAVVALSLLSPAVKGGDVTLENGSGLTATVVD